MRDYLRSYGILRGVNPTAMTVEAVISTGNVGRDQFMIDPDGWDFDNYRRNPIVLWGHDDLAMPVARTIGEITRTTTELIATAEFDTGDPDAERLFGKIARGYVNSTSVRWLPKRTEIRAIPTAEGGERDTLIFTEQELLEWSFVTIPADPGAMILRADGSGIDIEALMREHGKAAPTLTDLVPRLLDLLTDDLDADARAMLATLHARIATVITEPVVAGRVDDRVLAGIERVTRALTELRPPDVETLVVSAVARHTGKTEERVRAELAGG